jgi:hypothetical protein
MNYTRVNTNVAAMSDVELEDYRQLLREVKALLPLGQFFQRRETEAGIGKGRMQPVSRRQM